MAIFAELSRKKRREEKLKIKLTCAMHTAKATCLHLFMRLIDLIYQYQQIANHNKGTISVRKFRSGRGISRWKAHEKLRFTVISTELSRQKQEHKKFWKEITCTTATATFLRLPFRCATQVQRTNDQTHPQHPKSDQNRAVFNTNCI